MPDMQIFVETERLFLREVVASDAASLFAMDSDAAVHRYLGNKPVLTIEQSQAQIAFIQQQYRDNGIGRWAVVEKQTGHCVGWAGLKLITTPLNQRTNFYDLGYRFAQPYWGRGYATESARAALEYGFHTLHLPAIYSIADVQNQASNHVLTKIGFTLVERFDLDGEPHNWYHLACP